MSATFLGRASRLWQRYQAVGITPDLDAQDSRHVRALNGIIFIVTALLWLQLPVIVSLLPETRYILASFVLAPLIWQFVPLLNHQRRYTAARLLFSTSCLVLITVNAIQLGPETEHHLFIVSVILGSFVIYPPRQMGWILLVVGVSLLLLVGLEWFYRQRGGLIPFPDDIIELTRWSSLSALMLVVLGITLYHYRVVASTEHRLALEYERSEGLLRNILPVSIGERLKRHEKPIADQIDDAGVLFADLVGFTELAHRVRHERVVEILDDLFSAFDRLATRHGLEKIKTIGDAYMIASGVPEPKPDHHSALAACALDMLAVVRGQRITDAPGLGLRIGIHCGPVVAGVICETKFAYDIWGDTVNTASRMESHGVVDAIQVSAEFRQRLQGAFSFDYRGSIEVKGKGRMETYLLTGRRVSA